MTDQEIAERIARDVMGWTDSYGMWIDQAGQCTDFAVSGPGTWPRWDPNNDDVLAFRALRQWVQMKPDNQNHADITLWPRYTFVELVYQNSNDLTCIRSTCLRGEFAHVVCAALLEMIQ